LNRNSVRAPPSDKFGTSNEAEYNEKRSQSLVFFLQKRDHKISIFAFSARSVFDDKEKTAGFSGWNKKYTNNTI
jgi:hypothetical protein